MEEKYLEIIKKVRKQIQKLGGGSNVDIVEYLVGYGVPQEDIAEVGCAVCRTNMIALPSEYIGMDIGLPPYLPFIRVKGLCCIRLEFHSFSNGTRIWEARPEGKNVGILYFNLGHSNIMPPYSSLKYCPQEEFLNEFKKLNIENWDSEYIEPSIYDGLQWKLTVEYTYKKIKIVGSNAYPDNFEELKKLMCGG